ncbi:MAG: hypothetical protein EBR82_36125 [Caulobacteraceae bacterium]|nr:hypothetical protein [Caulobacteraceae bacterium]
MDRNRLGPWLMIAGGLLLLFGNKLPQDWGSLSTNVAGSTVVLVNEKTAATVDQTIALRAAKEFVDANKLAGYRNADRDDEWAKSIVEAGRVKKLEPPIVAYVDLKDGSVSKVRKVVPWKTSFEDSLK